MHYFRSLVKQQIEPRRRDKHVALTETTQKFRRAIGTHANNTCASVLHRASEYLEAEKLERGFMLTRNPFKFINYHAGAPCSPALNNDAG